LLLCSEYYIALFSNTFSSYIKSYYKQHTEKEKQQEFLSQVSSFSLYIALETFALIQQLSIILFAFLELDTHKNTFFCNICKQVLLNIKNMKRYCSKNYASNFKHIVTLFIIAQSLLKSSYLFQVQVRLQSIVSNIVLDI